MLATLTPIVARSPRSEADPRDAIRPRFSVGAGAGRDLALAAKGRGDVCRNRSRRQSVADILIRPCLGEDDAAHRTVLQDQRAAAVARIDLRVQLEDVTGHTVLAINVATGRLVFARHRRGNDREIAPVWVAE